MEIIHEDGLYRHIRFKRPESGCMRFDLVTYPGYLVYSGDMGCYVFNRLDDMFEFFRTDREYAKSKGKQLAINQGYWSEKLVAVDGGRQSPGAMEFDYERFVEVIKEYRLEWIRDAGSAGYNSLTKEQRRELWEAVEEEVLSGEESEHYAFHRANEFIWSAGPNFPTYRFEDLFEHRFTNYTFHFTWCCYALAWGIQKYDESKA